MYYERASYPLTAEQFATVLQAAFIAEAEGLVTFNADLRDALNSIGTQENGS
jgi:hypothetical protein